MWWSYLPDKATCSHFKKCMEECFKRENFHNLKIEKKYCKTECTYLWSMAIWTVDIPGYCYYKQFGFLFAVYRFAQWACMSTVIWRINSKIPFKKGKGGSVMCQIESWAEWRDRSSHCSPEILVTVLGGLRRRTGASQESLLFRIQTVRHEPPSAFVFIITQMRLPQQG